MIVPDFIGGSAPNLSSIVDPEECINLYVELNDPAAASKKCLYPTAGASQLSDLGSGLGRAHIFISGREFAVVGTAFVEYDVDGVATSRGTVASDDNPATISANGANGDQLFITSGGSGYIFTLSTNAFAIIASQPWTTVLQGAFLDSYFIALDPTEGRIYVSDLLDGTTWDPLQYAERSLAPDPWIAMAVFGRNLWLFGSQTSEVWYNVGSASSFPFAPYPVGLIQWGTPAPFSIAVDADRISWLGQTKQGRITAVSASGFTPEPIFGTAWESLVAGYSSRGKAIGEATSTRGHSFYEVSFPEQDVTWCWDFTSQETTKKGEWVAESDSFIMWGARWHVAAFGGELRALSASSGALYAISINYTTDTRGEDIVRLRRGPVISFENKRLFFGTFELDLEPGLGTVSGQGEDPQVMMRISNDGGKTWSTELMRGAGKLGEYGVRVRWTRGGSGRRRVYEIRMSDPIPWRISNAYVEISGEGLPGGRAA